jgi:hypothetical protein
LTLADLGAVGEFVGSILTLATLAYLAVQIRQNTAQQRREELISVQHGQNAVVAQFQDPRVLGGYVRTAEERTPSIEDRGVCFSWVVQYLNQFQVVHALHRDGTVDDEQYELWAGFAVAVVAPRGVRRWWNEENGRLGFQLEVRELIDRRLADRGNPPVPLTEMWSQFDGAAWDAARDRPALGIDPPRSGDMGRVDRV